MRARRHPDTRLCIPLVAAVVLSCQSTSAPRRFDVVRRLPHDTAAYTQGLVYAGGQLYESTGRLGRSEVRKVDLLTGGVTAAASLAPDRFGEGLALLDGRLFQLTWKSGVGYVYDAATLARTDSFSYAGEGWGLTTDGISLIMSDGTATLRFLDPSSFEILAALTVRDGGSPLTQLNELEYVKGQIYANVYQSDWIVRIDARTGEVREWIDLAGLLPRKDRTRATDVLNGIAHDAASGHFLVTGKLWPTMFELRLHQAPGDSGSRHAGDRDP
ncbi:MAG: glutaminyl-peptide cyclotransferase [Gemmatimonadota bacterium]|nr:glutaminyl-peptide cyclotransferase [Gemmatimonadota bacterium]MDH3369033.1 glutaminyl-peptide cyclotransferase [Gemmatimonadota bacterium]MDH3479958.1 glutaminyl-peptide cyclotransferase [Gemmatimonadota bacterium]MDH3570318.1 glutaminyl-peptide cyclotransferase [Gemmatimonadota bacterium]MDH5551277.1 glutaminyl-peptide cyclotransferase [Gemmatimonadota bacterium]